MHGVFLVIKAVKMHISELEKKRKTSTYFIAWGKQECSKWLVMMREAFTAPLFVFSFAKQLKYGHCWKHTTQGDLNLEQSKPVFTSQQIQLLF